MNKFKMLVLVAVVFVSVLNYSPAGECKGKKAQESTCTSGAAGLCQNSPTTVLCISGQQISRSCSSPTGTGIVTFYPQGKCVASEDKKANCYEFANSCAVVQDYQCNQIQIGSCAINGSIPIIGTIGSIGGTETTNIFSCTSKPVGGTKDMGTGTFALDI